MVTLERFLKFYFRALKKQFSRLAFPFHLQLFVINQLSWFTFRFSHNYFLPFLLQYALKSSHFDNMKFSNVFENRIHNSKISHFNFVKAETFEIRAFRTHLTGISQFLTTLRKSLYTLPVKIKKVIINGHCLGTQADSQSRNLKKCMKNNMENIDFDLDH